MYKVELLSKKISIVYDSRDIYSWSRLNSESSMSNSHVNRFGFNIFCYIRVWRIQQTHNFVQVLKAMVSLLQLPFGRHTIEVIKIVPLSSIFGLKSYGIPIM
jgi:hypothetical protein